MSELVYHSAPPAADDAAQAPVSSWAGAPSVWPEVGSTRTTTLLLVIAIHSEPAAMSGPAGLSPGSWVVPFTAPVTGSRRTRVAELWLTTHRSLPVDTSPTGP